MSGKPQAVGRWSEGILERGASEVSWDQLSKDSGGQARESGRQGVGAEGAESCLGFGKLSWAPSCVEDRMGRGRAEVRSPGRNLLWSGVAGMVAERAKRKEPI